MMALPSTRTIFVLVLLTELQVLCQDYISNYQNYDEAFIRPVSEGPLETENTYAVQSYECAKECFCPHSYPFAMYCDHRKLKAIPGVPSHILHLYAQYNEIEAITAEPFANATSLRDINLSHNRLQSSRVQREAFKKLERLLHLHLEHNNLEDVPPSLPKTLQRLHLGFNKISKITADAIQKLTDVAVLDLCSNRLTDAGIRGKALSGMRSLMQINMCSNKLKSMPSDLPASLLQLSVENNSISSIPEGYFRKTPNIMSLRAARNKLKAVPYNVFNLSRLMDLNLGHNQLSKTFFVPKTLEHLYLNHNDYKELNVSLMCPSVDQDSPNMLTYIRIDNNKLRGPVDYHAYACFPRMRMIFYGEQQKVEEYEPSAEN
ncbi:osteomodulin [Salminus brasiliensis]|uniref:osteomodulin n=1 Tax=Salminus brasiliensis TaxID=930266 RepID=UPI003B83165C